MAKIDKEFLRTVLYRQINERVELPNILIPPSYFIDLMRYIGNKRVKKKLVRYYGKTIGKDIYKDLSRIAKKLDKIINKININIKVCCKKNE